ncbi:circadian clock protein KaiC [Limimonas halophila]|uniref:non-specific serine/threonine protein kinase n=1 Tax=Limimonas halophila TaxID=1082479 RepID=A0A1G7M5L8_9PROT|nr:ATPase domain-containing protein [Limimonas halophila]SDF57058.1 circadian clock protein KaiC [Limimonas halophila]
MTNQLPKISTGLESLDRLTEGGLPKHRATLVVGAPGAGKTVFALQILANAAQRGTPCAFVTFEEGEDEILANARSFTWDPSALVGNGLTFFDGRPTLEALVTGEFELDGLTAGLGAMADQGALDFVVLDGLDQVLSGLSDVARRRAELYRVLNTLTSKGVTVLITAKGDDEGVVASADDTFMQFAAQCVIALRRRTATGAMVRTLQVVKYRGSAFGGSEVPYVIDEEGIVPALVGRSALQHHLSRERVPTGVPDLDDVLSGGYLRGSVTMISGAPGTAKTTLAASFVERAADNGERALYVAFDESFQQIVLDVQSLNRHLDRHQETGAISGLSLSGLGVTAEENYIAIRRAINRVQPSVVVIDPVSAFMKGYDSPRARGVAERMVDMLKSKGITAVITSLVEPDSDFTASAISTLADSWISLSYTLTGVSRGRALSVIKARGTQHSHDILHLVLGDDGVRISETQTGQAPVTRRPI